jgi:hypothetical protein
VTIHPNLSHRLFEIGLDLFSDLREKIKDGAYASGDLHESVRFNVEGTTLSLYADETFQFVEHGRKAGSKMPPEAPIKAWMQTVGIDLEHLFAIRKSIAIQGIDGKFFLRDMIEKKESSWHDLLSDSLIIDFTDALDRTFKEFMI